MEQDIKIGLGDVARDKISGFEGVVTGVADFLHACHRLQLQPAKVDDETGKPKATAFFDSPQLELVKKGNYKSSLIEDHDIELGDLAVDCITKFEGVVVTMTRYMDMATRVSIQPSRLNEKTGLPTEAYTFNAGSLDIVKKGTFKPEVVETKEGVTKPPPGGPDRGGFDIPSMDQR